LNWEEINIKSKIKNKRPNTHIKNKKIFSFLVCVFCFWFFIFGLNLVYAEAYDGVWFMGFNLKHDLFKDVSVRQAVMHCLDRNFIATTIMSAEAIPGSFIPPGMMGYDPSLKPYKFNPKFAKTLMKRAKLPTSDQRLKNIKLLHTDGLKTIAIAQEIKDDLKNIGMKVELIQISYRDQNRWVEELSSGASDLYLMGYKADIEKLFTSEAGVAEVDSTKLIEPLFKSNGEANFSGYVNADIDSLLDQLATLGPGLSSERETKLKEINKILYKDLPAVVLFYIEKL